MSTILDRAGPMADYNLSIRFPLRRQGTDLRAAEFKIETLKVKPGDVDDATDELIEFARGINEEGQD
jgi:hypothetical protein